MRKRNLVPAAFVATALMVEGAIALSRHGQSAVTVLAQTPAVPLAPIETGIALRDQHLREILETEKYPTAILQVPRSEAVAPEVEVKVEMSVEDAPGISRGILTASPRDH